MGVLMHIAIQYGIKTDPVFQFVACFARIYLIK
jgi:hypothetical protein